MFEFFAMIFFALRTLILTLFGALFGGLIMAGIVSFGWMLLFGGDFLNFGTLIGGAVGIYMGFLMGLSHPD